MKIHTLHFVSLGCISKAIGFATAWSAIACTLVIVGAMGTVKAQNNVPSINQFVLNGLFTPTSAQRFFEEGRRNIEREAQILEDPEHYFGEGILLINTVDIELIKETGETKPIDNWTEDNLRYEFD